MGCGKDHSFIVYIDESGDEGWSFTNRFGNKGSSEWLTICAAVFRADTEPAEVKCVDRARVAMGRPANRPIHFTDLSHEHKVLYCQEIAKAQMKAVAVALYKPSLSDSAPFRLKRYLYHYGSKLLLERISWLCRDRFAEVARPISGDGSARIIFSHRRVFSQSAFQEYLDRLDQPNQNTSIDWNVIDGDHVEAKPHALLRGLQVADALASSMSSAIEKHPKYGFTEGRYIQELFHKFYSKNGKTLGYGLKPYPSAAVEIFTNSKWECLRKMAGSRS